MKHARQELWTSAEVSRLVALLSSERDYLARILDALPTPIAVLSDGMHVAMANDAFWAAIGERPENGLGRHIDDLTGDVNAASAIRQALESKKGSVEFAARRAALPTFALGQLAGSGELVLAGRTGPSPAVREPDLESENFRAAFIANPEPQVLADSGGTLTHVNRAASLLGLETGTRLRDLFPQMKPGAVTAADLDGTERRLQLPSGRESIYGVVARPLGGGSALVILQDVGERELIDQRQRFGDRMDAVSRLAGGVSHELNNVLTVISSYCHIALDQIAQGSSPSADVEAILKAAGDATQLGNQLVALGRRHVVQEGPTDLNEVLLGLERTIRGISGETVRVTIATEPRLPAVPMDPRQLERAVLAIVLHAREAMPHGGTITITTAFVNDRVILEIADTRKWPDEAISVRMFEPYAPWPGSSRKHSGLELAVAWCLLQQRGAEMSVGRTDAQTVVRIAFPAAPQPVRSGTQNSTDTGRNAPAADVEPVATVLLVDDNAEIRRAIRHMLEREAYHVIDVGHPLQALRAIEQLANPIDVLVSDVNMPDMNGRELAQRARELRPGLKVLMISGYADEEIIIGQLFDEGVMFLQKPFSPDRLLKTMRNLIRQSGKVE